MDTETGDQYAVETFVLNVLPSVCFHSADTGVNVVTVVDACWGIRGASVVMDVKTLSDVSVGVSRKSPGYSRD